MAQQVFPEMDKILADVRHFLVTIGKSTGGDAPTSMDTSDVLVDDTGWPFSGPAASWEDNLDPLSVDPWTEKTPDGVAVLGILGQMDVDDGVDDEVEEMNVASSDSFSIQDEDGGMEDGFGEDLPTDPSQFLHLVLGECMVGLRSIAATAVTPEVERAMIACRTGMEYIKVLDGGVAEAEYRSRLQGRVGLTSGIHPKVRRGPKGRGKGGIGPRLAAQLPAEILLRIFSFLSESDASSPSASTLYACSLVSRDWSPLASEELWKRVTMDDDASRLGRFVLALRSQSVSSRGGGARVRVLSVACTDAELSLLALAAGGVSALHSLELRRSLIPNASSYRLLSRVTCCFPHLRSLYTDMIPPGSLNDVAQFVRACPELSNLHISMGAQHDRDIPQYPTEIVHTFISNIRLWVPYLAASCPSLAAVRIDDCGDISMDVFVGLWRRCELIECIAMRKVKRRAVFTDLVPRASMKKILLDGCWMNDYLCASVGKNAPNLEIFYIEDDWADDDFKHPQAPTVVNELSDEGVIELANYQRNLRAITFIGFPGRRNFSAYSLSRLLEANPKCFALNLARMDPQWPHRITDAWLLELAPALKHIEVLELYIQNAVSENGLLEALSGWSQLGDETLAHLPSLCPCLERLDMAGAGVSAAGLQGLVDRALKLKECVVTVPQESEDQCDVQWGKVIQYDDPVSEDVFSPYSVWEREVRRLVNSHVFADAVPA
ncbi:hypothetical protein HK101_005025 [Irineochytrium annulatum]|nr:hypothetical protein HK101_005025 [Irineochytrium annulatum]